MSGQITVDELGRRLHKCADYLRGSVDKGEYKDYILPLVFYAEMNRRYQQNYEQELRDAGYDPDDVDELDDFIEETFEELAAEDTAQDIQIPSGYSWSQMRNIGEDDFDEDLVDDKDTKAGVAQFIDSAFRKFEEMNPQYEGVFEDDYTNVTSFTGSEGDQTLKSVIDEIDNALYEEDKEVPPDTMGEAFMYLVKQFAEEEAGEYFTPPRIVRLTASLIEPFDLKTKFHDPTVGSGGMLVEAANQVRELEDIGYYDDKDDLVEADDFREFLIRNGFEFSGQELNPTIVAVAKMNLALNRLDGDIQQGNSLTNPKFTNGQSLEEFDSILANFPFSQSGWKDQTETRSDKFGDMNWSDSLPHGNYGDFAFVMHMFSHLSDEGKMATLIPHGVLFRNGDQDYREYIIENDLVEAVIGLPENLFESTGIPSGILVLNKNKPDCKKGEVMFLNADHEGRFYRDTGSNRNRLVDPIEDGEEGVQSVHEYADMDEPTGNAEIKHLFEEWTDVERVCRVVDNDEIRENEYNMNIALYVDTTEPQEDIDVQDTLASVRDIEHEYQQLNQQFTQYMQQLNYEDKTEETEEGQENNQGDKE